MALRVESKKWILYRHTSSFDIITAVAVNLKYFSKTSITSDDKLALLKKLRALAYYKERNPELPLDSINHRTNTLAYYMFGYKDKVEGKDRFLFSPLGNLFLKYIEDKKKTAKIFLTMLWAVQFQHPHSGTNSQFQLYPFRLIFKLLSDNRLSNKLFAFEVAYLIVFIKEINPEKHVDISSILYFSTMLSAFIKIEFYDYQPADISLSNLVTASADLTNLFFESESLESISCMHTIEHIGLGRYGDPLDPQGDIKAINELQRVTKKGGNLLLVVPLGMPRIQFNAHRIYSFDLINNLFHDFKLNNFSLITDANQFIENADPSLVKQQLYGCGCFWYVKK